MPHATRKPATLAAKLRLCCGVLVLTAAALMVAEFVVRFLRPDINHQGTARSLFRERVFGDSSGWQPNATGDAFGVPFVTDEYGFRRLTAPKEPSEGWLILGDSVAAGVGVEAAETFVGQTQRSLSETKLWHTAVVGYSAKDYLNVLQHFEATNPPLRRVVLFLCLNDIYPRANVPLEPPAGIKKTLGFLGRHSKLYLLLKNTFSDRSRIHFEADAQLYAPQGAEFLEFMAALKAIQAQARAKQCALTVVLLPYEYQLRKKQPGSRKPQEMITALLTSQGVTCIDAYPWMADCGIDSKRLFLYADAMHLSAEGHGVVFGGLIQRLQAASR